MRFGKTRIFTWSLYDFANTIFSMNVVSLNFPLMIKNNYGGANIDLSLARSTAMILIALTMPLAGTIADRFGRRMSPVMIFTVVCCLATALLGHSGSLLLNLAIFALAVYSYQSALVFYNAVLPQVAGGVRMERVSGYGVALGYIGTIFGLSVVGSLACPRCYADAFALTAVFFFLFALPFFLTVRDDNPKPLAGVTKVTFDSVRNLARVFRDARSRPGVLRFLLGRFFVVEALETIIFFMAI
jgi:UMF1 family MFS transporter